MTCSVEQQHSTVGGGYWPNVICITMISANVAVWTTQVTNTASYMTNQSRTWWSYILESPIRLFGLVLVLLLLLSVMTSMFESIHVSSLSIFWQFFFYSSLIMMFFCCLGLCRVRVSSTTRRSAALRFPVPRSHAELRALLLRLSISGRDGDFSGDDYDLLNRLDEDVETGSGASREQINNLPSFVYDNRHRDSEISHSLAVPTPGGDDNLDLLERGSASAVNTSLSSAILTAPSNSSEEVDKCTICLNGFTGGDHMRMLPCMHQYHSECIDEWLRRHATCPICKHHI